MIQAWSNHTDANGLNVPQVELKNSGDLFLCSEFFSREVKVQSMRPRLEDSTIPDIVNGRRTFEKVLEWLYFPRGLVQLQKSV